MRTFIAVSFSKEYEKYFKQVVKEVDDTDCKWVLDNSLHLTLHYLGEIDFKQMHQINNVFENCLKEVKPFIVTMSHFNSFDKRNKKIVYQEIEIGREDLFDLFEKLKRELELFDLPFQESLVPHITFARKVKHMNQFKKASFYQPFEIIDKVTLFLSHRNDDDVLEYLPITEYHLD